LSKKKPVITLDTSSIIDLEHGKDADLTTLYQWHKEGLIELVKTDVVDTERMGRAKPSDVKEDAGVGTYEHSRYEHSKYDENLSGVKEDIGTAVVNHSRVEHSKVGSSASSEFKEDIGVVVFGHTQELADFLFLALILIRSNHLSSSQ